MEAIVEKKELEDKSSKLEDMLNAGIHARPGGMKGTLHTKTSFGVVLCRTNTVTGRPEVVLVCKRYSYAFAEFVHGHYSRRDPRSVAALLDQMTPEELRDVLSLNFDQMWYRIWQLAPKEELYRKKLSKFRSLVRDGGNDRLQDLVRKAQGQGELLWEVPKGKKKTPQESGIICAVRELEEEAGVEKKDYRILTNLQPGRYTTRHEHAGVAYVCNYYVAVANPWLARVRSDGARPDRVGDARRSIDAMTEIGDARWMDIVQIRAIDSEKKIESLVAPVFKSIKLHANGKRLLPSLSSASAGTTAPSAASDGDRKICEMLNRKATAGSHAEAGTHKSAAPKSTEPDDAAVLERLKQSGSHRFLPYIRTSPQTVIDSASVSQLPRPKTLSPQTVINSASVSQLPRPKTLSPALSTASVSSVSAAHGTSPPRAFSDHVRPQPLQKPSAFTSTSKSHGRPKPPAYSLSELL